MSDRFTANTITSAAPDALYDRAEQAEAAIDRARALHHDWTNDPGHCAHCTGPDGALVPFPCPTVRALDGEEQPGPAATQATEPTPPAERDDTLVVDRYRTHRGDHAWCFRCWGTDDCDGWLSLDHHSQQSAERARDRHVTEEHPIKEQP